MAFFFLIYLNDLSIDTKPTVKLFADDTLLFSVIHVAENSWLGTQCKMSFNPDLNKQAQEVIFSRKMTKLPHPQISFNNVSVSCWSFQKHLGIYLDEKLNNKKMAKAMKETGVIKRLSRMFPRHCFLAIHKSFV